MENNDLEKSSSYTAEDSDATHSDTHFILWNTLTNQSGGQQQQQMVSTTDSSTSHTMVTDKEEEINIFLFQMRYCYCIHVLVSPE